jgi:hypothetical protein
MSPQHGQWPLPRALGRRGFLGAHAENAPRYRPLLTALVFPGCPPRFLGSFISTPFIRFYFWQRFGSF